MTISDDLFLSILSMDAYNRGYGSGLGAPMDRLGVSCPIGAKGRILGETPQRNNR